MSWIVKKERIFVQTVVFSIVIPTPFKEGAEVVL